MNVLVPILLASFVCPTDSALGFDAIEHRGNGTRGTGTQDPPKRRPPTKTGRITLPPRPIPQKKKQAPARIPDDPASFYRDVIDLRRSKVLRPTKEEQLLRSLKVHYSDPAGMAVKLAAQCKNDLLYGLMKVVDRYGTKYHAEELHFQVLSHPIGPVTSRVIRTIVQKSGASAKSKLFDYMTAKYSPVRKVAAEMLPMYVTNEDIPRLLMLSRERKTDVRRKVVRVLGKIDDPRVRDRLVQILMQDTALAPDACAAIIAQGPSMAPKMQEIVRQPATSRAFGYATYALVQLEKTAGEELLETKAIDNLVRELNGDDPLLRAVSAIALGTMAYRGSGWSYGARHDKKIVDGLLTLVAPEKFVTSLRLLQPQATEVLVRFSGRNFHNRAGSWRGWWTVSREKFVGLRRTVALTKENADLALLLWSADEYLLAFRGVNVPDTDLPKECTPYILAPEQMLALIADLRDLGFMKDAKLPTTPDVWTADFRVDDARVMMRLPSGEDGKGMGARFHRVLAQLARREMWQRHRDPKAQPDAAAFWRVERKWLAVHKGQENKRLVWHILRRLPKLDFAGRDEALTDLQSVPGLPNSITDQDASALIAVAKKIPKLEKSDTRLLEIALLAPGDLVWKNVLGVLEGRVTGAGGELAAHLFRLLGPERVVLATRHPNKEIAIAAIHDAAANRNHGAVPALLTRMKDKDAQIRRTAIYALGILHTTKARAALIAAEAKAEPVIRREIWGALGRIGGPGVARILMRAMEEPRLEDKLDALAAMGHVQDIEITRFLAARFVSQGAAPDAYAERAELSLRQIGPLLAAPALQPHLQMEEGVARQRLVLLLGEFQDPKVVPDLIAMLRSPKHEATAARLLSEITGVDLRKVDHRHRVMVAWYAANQGKGQVIWFLDVMRAAKVQTPLQPQHLTRRSGVGAVDALTRLLTTVEESHLRVMVATMLRETTGRDFTRGVRYAKGATLAGIADRYRIHAAAVRAAQK